MGFLYLGLSIPGTPNKHLLSMFIGLLRDSRVHHSGIDETGIGRKKEVAGETPLLSSFIYSS
jgi:hypothetical protein